MSEFANYLHEVFEDFGAIQTRKMFGGHGVYHQGLMFGLVADDELYLKVDQDNLKHFEAVDLQAFEYIKNGKPYKMSYYQAPESIFDEPQEALKWAQLAHDAAIRAAAKKNKR